MFFFFFKQKTAYEMRISDWSSDVCSSDLPAFQRQGGAGQADEPVGRGGWQLRLRSRRGEGGPGAWRRHYGLLHLPPELDDQLRRVPSAHRGELEDVDQPL